MEFNLFAVKCKDENCEYEFVTDSTEHTTCPSCGADILYTDDYIVASSNDILSIYIERYIQDKNSALTGIVIALAYINNDNIIARYDDNLGFRLNIKNSQYTSKLLDELKIKSISNLEELIKRNMNGHECLIIDPIFEFIERNYYYNEDGELYENGEVKFSIAKKFYNWILGNKSYIINMIH